MRSIGATFLGPKSFSRYLTRRRTASRMTGQLGFSLMLTPFVDCFSILVIFLLNQMSPEPEAMNPERMLMLPSASQTIQMKQGPIITLQKNEIYVSDRRVGAIDEILRSPTLLKQSLATGVQDVKLILQADFSTASTTITDILGALSAAGYSNVQMAVQKTGAKR